MKSKLDKHEYFMNRQCLLFCFLIRTCFLIIAGNSRRLLTFKRSLWAKNTATSITTPPSNRGKSDQQRIIDSLKALPLFRKLSSSFLTKLSEHVNEVCKFIFSVLSSSSIFYSQRVLGNESIDEFPYLIKFK